MSFSKSIWLLGVALLYYLLQLIWGNLLYAAIIRWLTEHYGVHEGDMISLSFDAAGFGHGPPIARDASTRFRDKWGAEEGRNKRAA